MSYRQTKPKNLCSTCFGLPHRRERPRCSGCLRPHAPEEVKPAEQRCSSAIAGGEES